MHLPPGGVVPDGYRRRQKRAARLLLARVVLRRRPHDDGVREAHDLAPRGPDPRGEHPQRDHGAHRLADLHIVPHPQGPRVHEHEPAYGLVHRARRADGEQQSHEDADPLEGVAVASRKIGVHHDEGEEPQDHRDDPAGGLGRLGVNPGDAHPAALDGIEEEPADAGKETGDQKNDGHDDEARDEIHDRRAGWP